MRVTSRVAGVGLAVAALALTVTGVVLAATDPNPGGSSKDPLSLNGYPPRTAQLHVVISTGQAYDVSADVNVNFRSNTVEALVQVPLAFSSVVVDLRLAHHHFYASSPNLSTVIGTHWLSMTSSQPALYGLSLEMTRPDIALISGFTTLTVVHQGYSTTYRYHRDNVAIAIPNGLPLSVPARANVDFTITLGKQGELTAASFAVSSAHSHASVTATVISYNAPARIVAPPARQVTPVDTARIAQLFGSSPLSGLLNPRSLTSLGQIRLS